MEKTRRTNIRATPVNMYYDMKKILLVAPVEGNGGIQSWTRKYIKTFTDDQYKLVHVGVSKNRSLSKSQSTIGRVIDGLKDLFDVRRSVIKAISENEFALMHTTTSGSFWTVRDYILNRICHKHGIKTIMHCRYGCIPEDYNSRSFWGWLLRKTMHEFDQVWVLDSRSESALKTDPIMKDKVFLTPNSIEVPTTCDLSPKKYNKIAFVGNLVPTKGLYELVEAVTRLKTDVELLIAGPGREDVIERIRAISGNKIDNQIKILGKLPNEKAVDLINSVDMIALPTYYSSEAFPISILEAMSRGKIVISCPRAAIKDMLTAVDGTPCGMLVRERSVDDIADAILWCQNHMKEADDMCEKAYEKAYTCYRTDVVYDLYRSLYRRLI